MPEIDGRGAVPPYIRQEDVQVDRSRLCPNPHPTPEQLEELADHLPWYWLHGIDDNGAPFRVRIYDCVWCHGTGVIQPEIDEEQRRHFDVEEQPWDFPARTQREWSPQWGGSGPTRR
jgi:hypothetical protein